VFDSGCRTEEETLPEDQRFYTNCTARETRGIGGRGAYHIFKTRIKKLRHPGLWRALYDLFREVGALRLRRHTKAVLKAKRYARAKGLKLHIGCADNLKTGWVNIDLSAKADLQLDMRERMPLTNGSVQMIYSEHFLEHLHYPEDAKRFLSESFRVLEAGV
jgi:hypothetical protein